MDFMDIDLIEEVPETPERFIKSCNGDRHSSADHGNGSSSCRVIDRAHFNQNLGNEQKEKDKPIPFNGNRRLFVKPDSRINSSSTNFGNSSSSSSFKNAIPIVRNPRHDKGKSLCNSSSVVDLTEKNKGNHVFGLDNAIKLGSRSSLASTPPRIGSHKRLVRNGCISPHNIAKAKHVAERPEVSRVTNLASDGPSSKVDAKDLIYEAKDSHRVKGKGVSHHRSVLENNDARNRYSSQRRSVTLKEATDASKQSEGWITPHNMTRNVDPRMVTNDQHRNGSNSSSFYNNFEQLEIDSRQLKERAHLTKRQREGVGSSNTRGSDVAYVSNADIAASSLNGDSLASRSSRNKNRRGGDGGSDRVTAVHRSADHGSTSDGVTSVRALQLEADEILARELQEQLYNEELGTEFGINEMDSHHALAMAIEHEHRVHTGGRRASHSRSNSSRHSSSNRAQASTSTRLARLRGRFPGRARTISSTRNSIFPPNMDVDMRMHILEALEAVNDMELPNNFLQIGREFNENDYEMLLALDDNNHEHGGATYTQINNLPQSTVQTENLQECAICLEAPNVGETIRHLPCLHKFHKDCIDEWLKRKTSCPVCKLSVT